MTTRNSRAGPTAFFAAESKASSTAATRTSRLMPFSRSQNSKTAKKSAFIQLERRTPSGEQKSRQNKLFRLWRAGEPAGLYRSRGNNRFFSARRQAGRFSGFSGVGAHLRQYR